MLPTLHLLCGKVASGKSTLADRLAAGPNTVLLREDAWLSSLFGKDMHTLKDYIEYSGRLKRAISPHVVALLKNGTSVVLDFQANTVDARTWMKDLVEQAGCKHVLHVLDIPDAVCKARLQQRNAAGKHEFSVTEEQFERISAHFQSPAENEGFNLEIHRDPS
jgi:predicted kinase